MIRLSAAFFCSGFAALLCQVVWQRMLGIFAGSDTVSAALVVGAFLAGLGLGSILGAKFADRLTPAGALTGFALAETAVSLLALLSKPFLYDLLALRLAPAVETPVGVLALCFAGLVLPTTLMGASLPLLSRAIAVSLDTVAERVGHLYGLNTLGAGLGALLGGWLITGTLGYVGGLGMAAALQLLAAGLALTLLPSMRRRGAAASAPARAAASGPSRPAPFGGLPLWCLLVFLSGYIIVALEILWVRVMGQVGQFHAYLFPTVLGVFLLADGAGMAVAARLVRRVQDPRPAFFLAQSAGFAAAAALLLLLWFAIAHWPLASLVGVDGSRLYGRPLLATFVLTLCVVAPPAFLIGMTFPFVQRAVHRDLASVGARVGWIQLANIAGNAAGSIGTGLVALHLLGTTGTVRLLAGLSLLLVLAWLWRARRGPARAAGLGLALACAAALALFPSNETWWRRLHNGSQDGFSSWAEDRSGVAFFREAPADRDPQAGAALGHARRPGPFFVMGHAQANIPFGLQQSALGAIGPLLHPRPRRILVIGVGSGGTPWGALVRPETEEVRAVELVRPVLTTLRDIARARPEGVVAALLADPRLTLEAGDGRRALVRARGQFEVIEADAILPQTSQSGLLYSREFLEEVRRRLAPGGLYVQWAASRRVVDTFASAFPYVLMLRPGDILIGSDQPIPGDAATLAERLGQPAILAHLARGNPAITAEALRRLVSLPGASWKPGDPRPSGVLTDLFPRDEFFINNPVVSVPASM